MAAATVLIHIPIFVYALSASAGDYTGGNGAQGTAGSFPNTGCVCNDGGLAGGAGGANGFGGGSGAAGATNRGYANSGLGGYGGAADSGGGGGAYYATGSGGAGGGAGGAGYLLTDGNVLTSGGATKGGNGGDGGYSNVWNDPSGYNYGIDGGGGGGGGGSGVIATGTATLTNTGNITGGIGGTGAFVNSYNSSYNSYAPSSYGDSGSGGAGGYGVRADGATSLTLNNSGNITGGASGDHALIGQNNAGAAGVYGQNITLTNTGGTIKGGHGATTGAGVEFTGGVNTLNLSAGSITSDYYGIGIKVDGGTNVFNISGGSVSPGTSGAYALQINGGTNTLNVTGGTLGVIYLGGGATTLEGTAFRNAVTLAHGATAAITALGGDAAGITSFDNHGGLTLETGRSFTVNSFTNEADGTLTLNANSQLISTSLNLIAGSTITGAGSLSSGSAAYSLNSGTISATLAGTGGLNKTGAGILTLSGANTYIGGTTISGGTLSITDGALGGGDVTMAQGTTIQFTGSSFTTTNNFFITGDPIYNVTAGNTQTVSGVIADADPSTPGIVEKTGAGVLVLSGANTYTGGTVVSAGTLTVGVDSVFGVSSAVGLGTLTLDGGTLSTNAFHTLYNNVQVTANGGAIDSGTNPFQIFGNITDSGAPGTLTIAGSTNGTVFFGGTNTYSAATVINSGGQLTINSGTALSANSDFTVNGTLQINGSASGTVKSLSGTGTITNLQSGNPILTIATAAAQTATFDGHITDGGGGNPHIGIEIDGAGTQIFSNAGNDYSGGTILTAGTLQIANAGALGRGALTFDGGTLSMTGAGTLSQDTTLNAGGGTIVTSGGQNFVLGSVYGTGGLTVDGTGILILYHSADNYSGGTTIKNGATLQVGSYNIHGDIANAGTLAVSTVGSGSTYGGLLSGAGAVIIQSTGDFGFTNAANTFNGPLTVLGGATLVVSSDAALGGVTSLTLGDASTVGTISAASGNIALGAGRTITLAAGGGTLQPASGATLTVSGQVTGGGVLTINDAGTVVLANNMNNYSGGTMAAAGTLRLAANNAAGTGTITATGGLIDYAASVSIANAITLDSSNTQLQVTSGSATQVGDIGENNGPRPLEKIGAGTLILSGTNTYSGDTNLTNGTLVAGSSSAFGNGNVIVAGGTLGYVDTVDIANTVTATANAVLNVGGTGTATQSGAVVGDNTVTLSKTGTGTLILTHDNTALHSAITLVDGTLEVGGSGATGDGMLLFNGGNLLFDGDYTLGNLIQVSAGGDTIDANQHAVTLNAFTNGTGVTGSTPLVIASTGGAGSVTLTGDSSGYSGAVTVNSSATLIQGASAVIPGGAYTVNGALQISSATITSLSGSGVVQDSNTAAVLTIAPASGSTDFSGTLQDNGGTLALVKNGAGTQTLSGTSTYTGGTTLNAGTLIAGSNGAFGAGRVAVTGGTLGFASGVNLVTAIEFQGDAALNITAGTATHSGDITDDGHGPYTITKSGAGTLLLTGSNNSSANVKLAAGILEIGSSGALGGGGYIFDGGTLRVDGAWTIGNDFQVLSGGTFDTNGYNTELTGTLSSDGTDGPLTIVGSGQVKISGINNLSGGAALGANVKLEAAGASGLGAGDVSMAAGSAILFTTTSGTFTNNFTLDGDPIFNVASGLTTTLTGVIADVPAGTPGVLEKTGEGTLVLAGANTYSGGTVLNAGIPNAGVLQVGVDTVLNTPGDSTSGIVTSAIGTGAVTFNGGTLQAGGDYTYANSINITGGGTIDANGHQFSLTGPIGSSGNGLTFTDSQGGGAVTVWNHNFINANFLIDHATVILAGANSGTGYGPLGIGTTTLDDGTLVSAQSGFLDTAIALGVGGGTLRVTDANPFGFGPISDAVAGAGALTIGAPGDTGTVALSDGSTYTGGTIIAGGTLKVTGGTTALGDAGGLVEMRSGTTLALYSAASLANNLLLDDATPVIYVDSGSSTLSGALLENFGTSGGFTKTGAGTLVLSGSSNYSGKTVVSAGTLQESYFNAIAYNSDVEVASGATLAIDGSLGSVYIGSLADHAGAGGAVTVGSGTDLYVGGMGDNSNSTTFSGILTADSLTYDGTGTLTLTGSGNTVDQLYICSCVVNGGITLSGNTMTTTAVNVYAGIFTVADGATFNTFLIDDQGTVVIKGASTVTMSAGGGAAAVVTGTATDAATLTVSEASTLTTDNLVIFSGHHSWPTPTVTVTGVGSTISVTKSVFIGNPGAGPGILTVTDGATLTTPFDISMDSDSTLNIGTGGTAGILDAPSITGYSGSDKIVADFTDSSTLSAQISGSVSLTKQGSGTLILTGANSYTGATTITAGSLQIGDGGSLGSGAVINNATLVFNTSTPTSLASIINGSGKLVQQGSGALTLTSNNGYTGETSIAANSTLKLTGSGRIQSSSVVTDNGVLDISGVAGGTAIKTLAGSGSVLLGSQTLQFLNGSTTFSGTITDGGAGGSVDFAGGNQILTGNNSWTGTTTIDAGATVTVTSPASLGGSAIKFFDGAVLKFTGAGTFNQSAEFAQVHAPIFDVTGTNVTWAGQITGVGDLAVTGSGGTLTLTNATNSYGGGTEVTGGAALNIDADGELGATATTLQLGDATTTGTLRFASAFTLNATRTVTLGASGGVIDTNGNAAVIASAITGTGSLTKSGTGTLTLTNTNSYGGGTTVAGGTLSLGTSGAAGTGAITTTGSVIDYANGIHVANPIVLNSNTTQLQALAGVTATQSGVISETGGARPMEKIGAGTLVLAAAETYTGGTTVTAGTVQLGAGGSLASTGALAVNGGTFDVNGQFQTVGVLSGTGGTLAIGAGSLTANSGANATLASAITGNAGAFNKNGTGTLTLAGANTFAGTINLLAGTLQVGNGGAAGSIAGNVTDNGALAFNRSDSATFAGVISGAGSVAQTGTGTTILTGTNAYTGGTIVVAGTLQIGAGGTTGSIAGNVTDNGALVFNRSDSATFAGVISGTGGLTQAGTGTTILTGTSIYTGGTTISSGTLQVGSSGTTGIIAGNVTDNAALAFNRSDNMTYAGVISGTGRVIQSGAGNLILTGANTYTGGTTISSGTLSVNGAIASSAVTVASGGTLGGTGTVGATTVQSGGALSPGNSIGTINVNGNLILAAGSSTGIELSPTAADMAIATGTATINGSLVASFASGAYAPKQYTLITSTGTLSGAFSAFNTLGIPAGFDASLSYDAHDVFLNLVSSMIAPPAAAFPAVTGTPNQIASGTAVQGGGAATSLYAALLNFSPANAQAAFDALSGEIHATLLASQFEAVQSARRGVQERMRAPLADNEQGWSLWGQAAGDWGSIDGNGNAAGANRHGVDITVGGDTRLDDNWRGGFEGGYGDNKLNVAARSSSAAISGGHVGAYAYGQYDAIALRFDGSYGFGTAKTVRSVAFTGFSDTVGANQDLNTFQLGGEAGYDIALDKLTLEPFAGLSWAQVSAGAFRETGAGAALSGAARDMDNGYAVLGLQAFTTPIDFAGAALTPTLRIGWQHAFATTTPSRALSFIGTGQSFTVLGTPLDADRALLDVGGTFALGANTQVSLGYSGAIGANAQDHTIRLEGVLKL